MKADQFIDKALSRGAWHVRLLALAEGGLVAALFIGGFLFFEIVLDHFFGLARSVRVGLLGLLLSGATAVIVSCVVMPLLRSVSSLYVARRVELAFPDFKNSLVTYVEMRRGSLSSGKRQVLRLVAHQAAARFEGVDVDAGLDSARFVRLGYAFVALVLAVFAFSILTPKSMLTSLMRALHPWADIAAPTRTHIGGVEPGNVRVVQGADVPVSASITGARPDSASIRWSRDGDLWQSVPMTEGPQRWSGALAHVETNVLYFLAAGDAVSPKYAVTALLPPVIDSVAVDLSPPAYTGLAPSRVDEGNIEAVVGTVAAVAIKSNKDLQSVSLKFSPDSSVSLAVKSNVASGSFTVSRSGRYAVLLTDSEGLEPARPVEYDVVALPDKSPEVAVKGPNEGAPVPLDSPCRFTFKASDDYGLTRMVFHFETDASNADVKNFILPDGTRDTAKSSDIVPKLLGAQPGDTVSYYLEAFDNRDGRPQSARTPTCTFRVAPPRTSLSAASGLSSASAPKVGSNLPGKQEPASGKPEAKKPGETKAAAPAPGPPKRSEGPRDDLLKMLDKDRDAWDTIARRLEPGASPSGQPSPKGAETAPSKAAATAAEGAPSPAPEQAASRETTVARADTKPLPAKEGAPQGAGGAEEKSQTGRAPSSANPPSTEGVPLPVGQPGSTQPSSAAPGPLSNAENPAAQAPKSDGSAERQPARPGGEKASAPDSSGQAPPRRNKESASSSQSSGRPGLSPENASPSSSGAAGARPLAPAGAPSDKSEGPPSSNEAGAPSGPESAAAAASKAESAAAAAGDSAAAKAAGPSQAKGDAAKGSSSSGKEGPSPAAPRESAQSAQAAPSGESTLTSPPSQSSSSGSSGASQGAAPGSPASPGGPVAGAPAGGRGASGPRPEVPDSALMGNRAVPEKTAPAPARPDARVAAVRRLVGRLAADISAGRMDPALLQDLGWQPSQLVTFVRGYEDVFRKIEPEEFQGQIVITGELDAGEVKAGTRSADSVGAVDSSARVGETAPDGAGEIPREEVSPKYKKMVDEYYRSLSQSSR